MLLILKYLKFKYNLYLQNIYIKFTFDPFMEKRVLTLLQLWKDPSISGLKPIPILELRREFSSHILQKAFHNHSNLSF